RETPSVAGIINPGSEGFQKLFFGQEEIAIPVHSAIEAACKVHPTADVFINFASYRSAYASSMSALKQPTIRVVAIIAEGVPEGDAKQLIAYARANNKVIIGPATVGGIQAGAFKIGDTAGTIDNIIQCKLYRPGSIGFVSKSIKMMVVLGELGGRDEYSLVEALKQGKVQKPVVAWVSGTCARLFKSEVQFGHAGAKSGGDLESAQGKNQALKEAGAIVPTSYEGLESAIKQTFEQLVEEGKIGQTREFKPPQIPEDLKIAIKSGKVRAPTHVISTICDDRGEELCNSIHSLCPQIIQYEGQRLMASIVCFVFTAGEEPTYSGVAMSTIVEQGYGVGDVISLLWFKRSLPRYCTKFIEICIMLCADHGPCVSGAHNTIVTARAGKDLVSSLVSDLQKMESIRWLIGIQQIYNNFWWQWSEIGLLTIGPRFGGAIDDAARYFKDACDKGLSPYEFVEGMKKKGIRVPGIGHRHTFDQKRLKQPLYRHPWEDVLYTK
ncbi:hypothetical protein KI387_014224, partial [Taxus chinensis]